MDLRFPNARWLVVMLGEGDRTTEVHAVPNFGRPHADSKDCWCHPSRHPVAARDPERAPVWVHHLEN